MRFLFLAAIAAACAQADQIPCSWNVKYNGDTGTSFHDIAISPKLKVCRNELVYMSSDPWPCFPFYSSSK